MNFFHHKDLGNHLLQLCPKAVKHPLYIYIYVHITCTYTHTHTHTHIYICVCVCVRVCVYIGLRKCISISTGPLFYLVKLARHFEALFQRACRESFCGCGLHGKRADKKWHMVLVKKQYPSMPGVKNPPGVQDAVT